MENINFNPNGIEFIRSSASEIDASVSEIQYPFGNILCDKSGAIFILGDSITEGAGATFKTGYAMSTARSILNKNTGASYPIVINQNNNIDSEWTTTGTIIIAGISRRLSLADGQIINITNRTCNYIDIVVDASLSSGSIKLYIDNALISTVPISGTELQTKRLITDTTLQNAHSVKIESAGGTIVVLAVDLGLKYTNVPKVFISGNSGSAIQDYTSTTKMDEIAYYLNMVTGEKLLIVALGTNNIYNPSKAKNTEDYISALNSLISGLKTRVVGIKFLITIPPKANELVYPPVLDSYDSYVKAIHNYCNVSNITAVDYSLTVLNKDSSLLNDGIHPKAIGHNIMSTKLCNILGVNVDNNLYIENKPIVYNSTYSTFSSIFYLKARAIKQKNQAIVRLAGMVQPFGSTATTIGTIPLDFRPINRDVYTSAITSSGIVQLIIRVSGAIDVSATGWTYLSLDGISYTQ